jgi:hypothetical protein
MEEIRDMRINGYVVIKYLTISHGVEMARGITAVG